MIKDWEIVIKIKNILCFCSNITQKVYKERQCQGSFFIDINNLLIKKKKSLIEGYISAWKEGLFSHKWSLKWIVYSNIHAIPIQKVFGGEVADIMFGPC